MKPHFGQSDAAMNKLAGCNSFPNSGIVHNQKVLDGLKTVASLETQAKNEGFETPFEMMKAKNRTDYMTPDPLPKGYYGHEDGCDCAVCENMYFHELHKQRVANDTAALMQLSYQMGFDAAKRKAIEAIANIPTRVEPISGQNFTYVQRDEAIGAMQNLEI